VDAGIASIVVAVIAGFAAILQQVVAARKENKVDHGKVQTKLDNLKDSVDRVEEMVEKVEGKIDDHITDHARGTV